MRSPGEPVTLSALYWIGSDYPDPGDVFRTKSGRRYRILEVRFRRNGLPAFDCLVMRADEPNPDPPAREWSWWWISRRRRRSPIAMRVASRGFGTKPAPAKSTIGSLARRDESMRYRCSRPSR